METVNDELLKGIAARIDASLICLEAQKDNEAKEILRRLFAVLPKPETRHINSARAELSE